MGGLFAGANYRPDCKPGFNLTHIYNPVDPLLVYVNTYVKLLLFHTIESCNLKDNPRQGQRLCSRDTLSLFIYIYINKFNNGSTH